MQRLTTASPSSGGQRASRWFCLWFSLSDNFSPSGIDVSDDRWLAQWRLCGKIVFLPLFFRKEFCFFRSRAWWFWFRQWFFFLHNRGQQWRLWLCSRWVFRVDLRLLQGFLNPRRKIGAGSAGFRWNLRLIQWDWCFWWWPKILCFRTRSPPEADLAMQETSLSWSE